MAFGELMGITNRLLVNAQALAAVAARMRLDELGATGDPAVRAQIDRAVDALGAGDHVDSLNEGERSMLVSFARSYLTQALDLVENPERPGAWTQDNPVLLQAQGSASGAVARLITGASVRTTHGSSMSEPASRVLQSLSARSFPTRPSSGSIPSSRRSRSHGRTSPPRRRHGRAPRSVG